MYGVLGFTEHGVTSRVPVLEVGPAVPLHPLLLVVIGGSPNSLTASERRTFLGSTVRRSLRTPRCPLPFEIRRCLCWSLDPPSTTTVDRGRVCGSLSVSLDRLRTSGVRYEPVEVHQDWVVDLEVL